MNPESLTSPTASAARTVFVVDDDPAARQSVAALIKSHGLPVETYGSGEEFLAQYDPNRRGCLVLDVRMAGMSGLDLQVELKNRGAAIPTIVITGYADVPMAVRAMHNGAVTFLEKPCADQELWENIEVALNQENHLAAIRARQQQIQEYFDTLTESEKQVMDLLLAGAANKTIAADLDIGLRTVEMRRAIIMKKMNANSLAELVRLVMTIHSAPS